MAIFVTDRISLAEDEIGEQFVRAPGPGGQNVNKLATAVQLRFDARGSKSLPYDVRTRLLELAGRGRRSTARSSSMPTGSVPASETGAFPISRSRAHTHRRHGHPLQTVPSAGLIERPQEKNRVDALR